MIGKLARDESGIALGLAIMVMVIIGVMGAGLLVFVRNDLEAVVEVNQGQKAFDIADAGVQAAKQQILGDKIPAHYDVEGGAALCNTDARDPDDAIDPANDTQRNPATENWAPGASQTRTFAGGQFTVTIQWLNQDPGAPDECRAPETTASPTEGVDYFRVISTSTLGDATRRVEAIYDTYSLNVPRAYYTPGEINVNGDACISRVSVFSLSDVTFAGGGNGCEDPDDDGDTVQDSGSDDPNGVSFKGVDLYYGDWNRPPHNTVPRNGGITLAGVGTAEDIGGNPEMLDPLVPGSKTLSRGKRDYDRLTSPPFKQTPTAGEMTFPFDLDAQPDAQQLCDEARAQNNYIPSGVSGNDSLGSWPSSGPNTVVCFEFTDPNLSHNHVLSWAVNDSPSDDLTAQGYPGCKGPIQDGTLVVLGGGFSISPNTDLFRGVVVVRGADGSLESSEVDSDLSGRGCLDGFINSSGPITLSGSITPSNSNEVNNRPGFYGVRTWSWRELYE